MMTDLLALGGMFLAALLAATPIPMQSELAFVALAVFLPLLALAKIGRYVVLALATAAAV